MIPEIKLLEHSAERLFEQRFDRAARDAAERGDWPAAAWRAAQEAGFTDIATAAADAGESPLPLLGALLRAAARHAVPLPLAEHALAQEMARAAGLTPPPGMLTVAPPHGAALAELAGPPDAPVLIGRLRRVPWGRHAAGIVVLARTGGAVRTVIRTGPALAEAGWNYAREPRDAMLLDGAVDPALVGPPGVGWTQEDLAFRGALLRAVQLAGAAAAVLRLTVEYAQQRVQFGRPIAKFQAVQQQIAVLASHATAAATAAESAIAAAACGADARFEIAAAKTRTGEAAGIVAEIAHQVHGAMGFTHEHVLHRSTRRLWSWRDEFGSEAVWADWLGRAVCRRPGEALWPLLTAEPKDIPPDLSCLTQEPRR